MGFAKFRTAIAASLIRQIVEPQLLKSIIPLFVRLCFCVLACVLDSQAGISLLGEVNRVRAWLITNGAVV